jgi:hypothetical protein
MASVTLKVTIRLGTSAEMESCSTHGRVASADRTRLGQPTAQCMLGILSVTSGLLESAALG